MMYGSNFQTKFYIFFPCVRHQQHSDESNFFWEIALTCAFILCGSSLKFSEDHSFSSLVTIFLLKIEC